MLRALRPVRTASYHAELREIADGVYAYLQDGSWGFSNAGLVTSSGRALLVDTLYDLKLTARMLEEMRRADGAAKNIDTLVNTHANGDHCWGNQLVGAGRILSSRATADEMLDLSPRRMASLVAGARLICRGGGAATRLLGLLGRIGVPRAAELAESADFVVDCFGPFDFRGISVKLPTETFDGRLAIDVGDRHLELIQVGPAHTKGDVIVYLPKERIVFTGDILFVGSHPVMWEGPVGNWIDACDRLMRLEVDVIVPGHGPLTDKKGVQATKAYFEELRKLVLEGRAAGVSPDAIARDLFERGYQGWKEASRVTVNIDRIDRELAGDRSRRDPLALLAKMARLERGGPVAAPIS
jgi:glyoxylase-like metal-dependent hydrolase (beta-lactamase superfamily II)